MPYACSEELAVADCARSIGGRFHYTQRTLRDDHHGQNSGVSVHGGIDRICPVCCGQTFLSKLAGGYADSSAVRSSRPYNLVSAPEANPDGSQIRRCSIPAAVSNGAETEAKAPQNCHQDTVIIRQS